MKYGPKYLEEIEGNDFSLDFMQNKTICISGATGLICSYLIDSILIQKDLQIKIVALVRDVKKAEQRFSLFVDDKRLDLVPTNILDQLNISESIDFIIHGASLTDPLNYALYPIETMNTNFLGVKNLLDLAVQKKAKFLFISSCEVYGKNDKEFMTENDYGYIDILDSRACYNESKRAAETLCVSYKTQKNVDVVIPRLSRIYGPTMKLGDTKALSQFINKGIKGEDIILKSTGKQLFNYTYVSDVVNALLLLLETSNKYVAYNVTSIELVPLIDIAKFIADYCRTNVIFDHPSEIEKKGYSKSYVSSMDCMKIKNEMNWSSKIDLFKGIERTIEILREIINE